MERGVYFDGWFPGQYCQHPSMPPRRLKMLDDLTKMKATMLVWAGLGGGSISLPYLEDEAYGPVPERFRQYGFVNDAEFVAHCRAAGIDLFGIVFESQGWEFPAEIVDGRVVALTEPRGAAPRSWLGLREFTRDQGPAEWRPFAHYFPDGLRNSDGEPVDDLWSEAASRDLEGHPLHAHWVEVAARDQACYYMDRNNPVWREYLKAIIRIQIDAGVPGVQLDETDTPMSALRYGGCFCKDCVKGFRGYLQGLETPPAELADVDLSTFDYREYLLERGHRAGEAPQRLPLYQHYSRYLQMSIVDTYRTVAEYAHAYAESKGRSVRVGGNFYDLAPYYDGMIDASDVVITEMRETRYQQPWWFRHGVGLSRGRPVVAVENPYGGMVPELLKQLQAGRARDRFRLTIFEAAAMGANMSLPYGSWLGTEIEDCYWAPQDLVEEVGGFLAEIDHLIVAEGRNEVAVAYSTLSNVHATIDGDQFSDEGRFFTFEGDPDAPAVSYWPAVEALSRADIPFDVVVVPDEAIRPNDLTAAALARYSTVVLPDCWAVSPAQHRAIVDYLGGGGHVIVQGAYGTALDPAEAVHVTRHPHTRVTRCPAETIAAIDPQVEVALGTDGAVNLAALPDGGCAVHLLNYRHDGEGTAVVPRPDLTVRIRIAGDWSHARLHRPGCAAVAIPVRRTGTGYEFTIPRLDTYAVVHLS